MERNGWEFDLALERRSRDLESGLAAEHDGTAAISARGALVRRERSKRGGKGGQVRLLSQSSRRRGSRAAGENPVAGSGNRKALLLRGRRCAVHRILRRPFVFSWRGKESSGAPGSDPASQDSMLREGLARSFSQPRPSNLDPGLQGLEPQWSESAWVAS